MLRQNGNSVRVTGRDLIYSIPDDLTSPIQDTNVITVIPANPAYWKGTRIAALASGYQNYRPILFKITYVPMCAVTQQGNVIGGTIWDDGIDNDNLQQSLRTSNGGFMTQCYVPHTTRIRPKSNLQFNLYRMGGEFSTTSNPFIFIAMAIGCKNTSNQRITPGYFYVTWSFELKNPIGSINTYNNSGLITYSQLQYELNNTIININPSAEIPFGAYVDVEVGEDGPIPMYNGTPIEITDNTPVWAFTSVTKNTTTRSIDKIPILYDGVTTATITLTNFNYVGYILSQENHYDIYIRETLELGSNYRKDNEDTALLITNELQNFGEYQGLDAQPFKQYKGDEYVKDVTLHVRHYKASKTEYNAILATKYKKQTTTQMKIIYKRNKNISLPKTQEQPEPPLNQEEPKIIINQDKQKTKEEIEYPDDEISLLSEATEDQEPQQTIKERNKQGGGKKHK
jgi:hypothetical protein